MKKAVKPEKYPVKYCKTKILTALLFSIPLCCSSCSADIYKWQDSQGKTHYGEHARGSAKAIAIDPGFTYSGVKKVYDGDTVVLDDGRKVRLLGINTPEVAHRGIAAEAGGEAALIWLENYLRGKHVRLQMDAEKQDKYGRVLAYLFSKEGVHINVELVKRGLAAVTVHPPNFLYTEALLAAQRSAEVAKLGIWRDPAYAVKAPESINRTNDKGWQRVQGRVDTVKSSRKYLYLNFSPQFSARIAHEDLPLFNDPDNLTGKQVEVRGWLMRSKDRYTLPLLHPSALIVLP